MPSTQPRKGSMEEIHLGFPAFPFLYNRGPSAGSPLGIRSGSLSAAMAETDGPEQPTLESSGDIPSVELIRRVRGGDQQALDALFARYVPMLQRWATGRLPLWA